MHLKLPLKWEEKLNYWRYKLLPRTLFFRTMLLIFLPLIGVQIVSVVVFFDSSWSRMGRRMADGVVENIRVILDLHRAGLPTEGLALMADKNMQMDFEVVERGKELKDSYEPETNKLVIEYLRDALRRDIKDAYWKIFYDKAAIKHDLAIIIDDGMEVYRFACPRKKVFSSSIFMFVVWMVVTSVLLLGVSMLFLRIQVRAIADLARTSENFGKGIYDDGFKPYGSSEVRKAGLAFIKMKERIVKQIAERTQMLARISHDLRTPLTRMRLVAAMMPEGADKKDFLADIKEMEEMLNGYLAFVRGEGNEEAKEIDIVGLVKGICDRFRVEHKKIRCFAENQNIMIIVKEQAIKSAITNVIANACRYGKKVAVRLGCGERKLTIIVEDNGPGIPEDKREDVFKAFYRLENSRNKETGGIGLGLAITKDIVVAHGGKIMLGDSKLGGLKFTIELPI